MTEHFKERTAIYAWFGEQPAGTRVCGCHQRALIFMFCWTSARFAEHAPGRWRRCRIGDQVRSSSNPPDWMIVTESWRTVVHTRIGHDLHVPPSIMRDFHHERPHERSIVCALGRLPAISSRSLISFLHTSEKGQMLTTNIKQTSDNTSAKELMNISHAILLDRTLFG